jgi:hypothetical protein
MRKIIVLLVLFVFLLTGCVFPFHSYVSYYDTLTASEILTMDDDDLYQALIMVYLDSDPEVLRHEQRMAATLINFDAEMMNGGLCQFFVNDHTVFAQYVVDALNEVGAVEMQSHYTSFISQNGIDVTDRASFRIGSQKDYEECYARFPYDAFDQTFSEIYQEENLRDLLISYVRLHSDEIFD